MFEQDYIVRLLVELAASIRRSLQRGRGEKDFKGACECLESSITEATDMNGVALLSLTPDSLVSVLQIANTDPRVVVYIANSLNLLHKYYKKLNNIELSKLRLEQAQALAQSYDFELSDSDVDNQDFDEEELMQSIEKIANK